MTGPGVFLVEGFRVARDGRSAGVERAVASGLADGDLGAGLPGDSPEQAGEVAKTVAGQAVPDKAAVSQLGRSGQRQRGRPFSLRLSFEEREQLEREAGDMPLGAYIRWRLFGNGQGAAGSSATRPRVRTRRVVADQQALGQLLAKLGEARLANNLNQLAKAANTGSLPVTPETEAELRAAYGEVQAMRRLLLRGLGAQEPVP